MTYTITTLSKSSFLSWSLVKHTALLILSLLAIFMVPNLVAHAEENGPTLTTNQSWIENQTAGAGLKINSAQDAFEFVFSKLPKQVFVYPTENYYYFTFPADGVVYAGNLRLAAQDRDQGIIHFAAFKQANQTSTMGEMMYRALTEKDGVSVEKLSAFSYRVTYQTKSVIFNLNDVSAVKPPKEIIADGEQYIGLVVDESGIRFFMFYNETHKVFSYILDETGNVLDKFEDLEGTEGRIQIGLRSGFAFYNHHYLNRRVLIGVHGANTVVNNYFDGPADQLPENHIVDDNLRKSIEDSDPSVEGMLDTFGYFNNGSGRYLISPYIQYEYQDELFGYDECAANKSLPKEIYDACFYSGDE
jgi:hypothetical protein